MNRTYAHPSHVNYPETAGHRPTREQLLEQQDAADKRRRRAAKARHNARRRTQ